jgi:predicted nucleic acid-binding protein
VSKFIKNNVIDTCAIWNILSSKLLYARCKNTNVVFCCTGFVIYESLYKEWSKKKNLEKSLKGFLKECRKRGDFKTISLDIEDLQEVERLKKRKKLGLGELSSIALAKKIGLAFFTDDQSARKMAVEIFKSSCYCQTTPHLVGWLFFKSYLSDSDKDILINQHKENGGDLETCLNNIYREAMRCLSLSSIT